jgi:RimJ/RimL family protein N-acetyltransferase
VTRLPDVLTLEGLELRRWDPAFTNQMIAAIRLSFAELQQWMAWAQTMPTADELRSVLAQGRSAFEEDRAWDYAVFERGAGKTARQLVGGAGLHPSKRPDCYEIGYWVRSDRTGRGIATAAAAALVDAAFTHVDEARRVVIRMDQANHASAAVPRKLGFVLLGEEDRDRLAQGHTGHGFVWVRDRMT